MGSDAISSSLLLIVLLSNRNSCEQKVKTLISFAASDLSLHCLPRSHRI